MTPRVYYNEIDPFAIAWLKELIVAGAIADGDIDTRSIVDVQGSDLYGYTRCHFFAGIAGWDLALHLAGWPADRPVWTGSCPCQGYSVAGKAQGAADARNLWPAWFRLIRECRPERVFGEQVENAVGHGWLDTVSTDLEAEEYTVGAAVLGAHSVRAPHLRQRLWFVAHSSSRGLGMHGGASRDAGHADERRASLAVADRDGPGRGEQRRSGLPTNREPSRGHDIDGCRSSGDAQGVTIGSGLEGHGRNGDDRHESRRLDAGSARPITAAGVWDHAAWIPCSDGKARPVESSLEPLADGLSADLGRVRLASYTHDPHEDRLVFAPLIHKGKARVGRLRGYGNAIVPAVAAEFIAAYMEVESCR